MASVLRGPYRRNVAAQEVEAPVAARETGAPVGPDRMASAETAPRPARTRVAAARGAWALGSLLIGIARLVRLVTGIVVTLIVVAIILRVLSANPANSIVRDLHDVGHALVGPFKNVFSPKDAKLSIVVNWGLAALVYLAVGGFVAGLIARLAPRGAAPGEPVVAP